MASKKNQNVLHIAMFPWLAYDHIMPYFELSRSLAQKGHKIFFISTPKNLNPLTKLIPQDLSHLITLVPLALPHVDGLPQGTESTSKLPIHKVPFLKKAYDKLQLGLTQFLEHSKDANWIIVDFACYWLPLIANRLGIKQVFFAVLNATVISFLGPPSELLGGCRQRPEDFTVVPRWMDSHSNIAYNLYEIVNHFKCMDPEMSDVQRWATVVQGCQAVIVRSCPEIESEALSLLGRLYEKPVFPIGLLRPSLRDDNFLEDEKWKGLKQWLDNKQEKSVVYIASGSELSLGPDWIHELAHGIEKSGLPFIWVLNNRPLVEGILGSDILPTGFETQVSNRGLVLRSWAPQLGILAHESIGGVMTHCGWSSVIEAIGFGRALILFAGTSSDQGLAARFLHGRKIGLEIPRDDKTGAFTRDSVAESIRRVMVDEDGETFRAKARDMRAIFNNVELQNKYLKEFSEFLVQSNSS